MGGFAVVFHRDGAPAEKSAVEMLLKPIEHRGPEGIRAEIIGAAGFGHCAAHLLPEDANCAQPLSDRNSQRMLVFEGRIDNREELLRRFELPPHSADAQIVLAAYAHWRQECPKFLLGDFAFALYDDRTQALYCARDIIGVAPFHYYCSDKLFLAGSEVGQLLSHPAVPPDLDEPAIAAVMAAHSLGPQETLRKYIRKLPAAHWLLLTKDAFQLQKYWNIRDTPEIDLGEDERYAERFWELLLEAVRCRWRSNHSVGILLSGGLDSTAIAAAAVELRRTGRIADEPIKAFSQYYPGLDCDESSQIGATVQQLQLSAQSFPFESNPVDEYQLQVDRYHDLPDSPNSACLNRLRATAFAQGTRTLLTGQGGDEWFTGSYYRYTDLLRAGRLRGLLRDAPKDANAEGTATANFLWTNAVRPLAPAWLVGAYRAVRGYKQIVPKYMDTAFANRNDLPRRLLPMQPGALVKASNYSQIRLVEEGDLASILEYTDRVNASFGLVASHPFLDRRLIEFALGIPGRLLLTNGLTKLVLRQALAGRIPEIIRTRRDKADYSQLFIPPYAELTQADFFSNMQLIDRGWIKRDKIAQILQQFQERSANRDYSRTWHIWPLWNVYCLEMIVRQATRH
jgi:asparagine synthase (glutamine-hydrolysing)